MLWRKILNWKVTIAFNFEETNYAHNICESVGNVYYVRVGAKKDNAAAGDIKGEQ